MKKVFLITVFLLLSFNVFSQEKFTTEDLIGYWEPKESSTNLVIWNDVKGNLQLIEFSTTSGTPLRLLSMQLEKDVLVVKSIFDKKNWVTECFYTFIDKKTLQCVIKGQINTIIIYTKIK
jgi:hypothetical protein